jgi:hypothetical protein
LSTISLRQTTAIGFKMTIPAPASSRLARAKC